MAIIGALLMRGPKYWEAEAIDLTNKRLERRREVAEKFRSTYGTISKPLPELHGKQQRVAKSPLMYKDSRLVMQRSSNSVKVKATCPYCKGSGCDKCNLLAQFNSIGVEITATKRYINRSSQDTLRPLDSDVSDKVGFNFLVEGLGCI